jgi:outer membrane biogenesis lipoprotein LolB
MMNFTTPIIASLCLLLTACSVNENTSKKELHDTPNPKSSFAELNENQYNNIPAWDGRINGCKSKQ